MSVEFLVCGTAAENVTFLRFCFFTNFILIYFLMEKKASRCRVGELLVSEAVCY
jgi:hypothetical protein